MYSPDVYVFDPKRLYGLNEERDLLKRKNTRLTTIDTLSALCAHRSRYLRAIYAVKFGYLLNL